MNVSRPNILIISSKKYWYVYRTSQHIAVQKKIQWVLWQILDILLLQEGYTKHHCNVMTLDTSNAFVQTSVLQDETDNYSMMNV